MALEFFGKPFNRVRLLAIIVVITVGLAVAFPVRAQVNRSEAGRLQGRWMAMMAFDRARSGDLTALNGSGDGDGAAAPDADGVGAAAGDAPAAAPST